MSSSRLRDQSHTDFIGVATTQANSRPSIIFDAVVDWHQRHEFLKCMFLFLSQRIDLTSILSCRSVEIPLDIHSDNATYETQFGHVQRPTHKNTTWDMAKFEVCGHKVITCDIAVCFGTDLLRSMPTLASLDTASLSCQKASTGSRAAGMSCVSPCSVLRLRRTPNKIKAGMTSRGPSSLIRARFWNPTYRLLHTFSTQLWKVQYNLSNPSSMA